MPEIRVVIVDDSAVIRRILRETLASDASIVVAGIAGDGETALTRIEQTQPDIVTLDVELPGMSGLETLKEVRTRWPKLPVVMFSTLTEKGALITLDALSLGASDYVGKPSHTVNAEETKQRIRAELIPKLKELALGAAGKAFRSKASAVSVRHRLEEQRVEHSQPVEIVALGTSTGGPNALGEMLPRLSSTLRVPIVVVQHMPALFTKYLADRLKKSCGLRVGEGVNGQDIQAGEVWIAPGDYHMTVERNGAQTRLQLNQGAQENSCRPAVDVLFRSVAKEFGARTLGVVLTGMGSDGVKGSGQIIAGGGKVIVQDEASSVVWGMPGQVAAAGYADGVYPLSEIAQEIERRVKEPNRLGRFGPPLQAGAR